MLEGSQQLVELIIGIPMIVGVFLELSAAIGRGAKGKGP